MRQLQEGNSLNKMVKVGIVGLGFGAEFVPIYQNHPNVDRVAICQRSEDHLHRIGDHFNIADRYTSFEVMLQDERIDAVHINSPIPDHAE
jgi:predicted dehydrogenase